MFFNNPINPRVDAFCRELALALRRITGRTVGAGLEQDLSQPLPTSNKPERKENNGTEEVPASSNS